MPSYVSKRPGVSEIKHLRWTASGHHGRQREQTEKRATRKAEDMNKDKEALQKHAPLSENERRSLVQENKLDLINGLITAREYAESLPKKFNGKWYAVEDLPAVEEEEMAKLAK